MTTGHLARRPTWTTWRRVALIAGVGAVTAASAYLAGVGLHIIPGRPALLGYAFLITQLVSAQNLTGGA